jgi:type I restriction enzyme, S subunit
MAKNPKLKRVSLGRYTDEVNHRNQNKTDLSVCSVTNNQGIVYSETRFKKQVFSKNLSKYKIIAPDEIAYNPSRVNVGSIAINAMDEEVLLSPMYVIVKCHNEILPKFLLYFLKSTEGKNRIKHLTQGSVRDSLSYKNFEKIEIFLPSVPIQEKMIQIIEQVMDLQKKRIQSLNILNKLTMSTFFKIFGDPEKNISKWTSTSLDKLLIGKPVHGKSLEGSKVNLEQIGVPLLKLSALTDFGIDPTNIKFYDENKKNLDMNFLQKNDILISRSNTLELVGRSGRYSNDPSFCLVPDLMIKVRPDPDKINPVFLEYFLRTHKVRNFYRSRARGTSGSMKKISNKDISNTEILIPDDSLQVKFSKIIEKIDETKSKMIKHNQILTKQIDSIKIKIYRGHMVN